MKFFLLWGNADGCTSFIIAIVSCGAISVSSRSLRRTIEELCKCLSEWLGGRGYQSVVAVVERLVARHACSLGEWLARNLRVYGMPENTAAVQ